MVRWWITFLGIVGSMGVILLSIVMLAHIGDETDPWAIFWFFVAVGATGVLYLAIRAENSPVQPQPVQRPPPMVEVVNRGDWQETRPRPIPMNLKK